MNLRIGKKRENRILHEREQCRLEEIRKQEESIILRQKEEVLKQREEEHPEADHREQIHASQTELETIKRERDLLLAERIKANLSLFDKEEEFKASLQFSSKKKFLLDQKLRSRSSRPHQPGLCETSFGKSLSFVYA